MTTAGLLDRLREAQGPDRELDADIWEAAGNCAHRDKEYYAVQDDTGFTCKDCGIDLYGVRIPALSASLDAALALTQEVLPGAGWLIGNERGQVDAELFDSQGRWINARRNQGRHKSPAIALLIALLSALQAKEADRGGAS